MRYGLKGHQARTLEEVGRAFGVTRERIRQIENNTLKKLEACPRPSACATRASRSSPRTESPRLVALCENQARPLLEAPPGHL